MKLKLNYPRFWQEQTIPIILSGIATIIFSIPTDDWVHSSTIFRRTVLVYLLPIIPIVTAGNIIKGLYIGLPRSIDFSDHSFVVKTKNRNIEYSRLIKIVLSPNSWCFNRRVSFHDKLSFYEVPSYFDTEHGEPIYKFATNYAAQKGARLIKL